MAQVQSKILDLLNREGRDLVALNVMRELVQIQHQVSQRQLKSLPQWIMGTLATVVSLSVFVLWCPWQWLDGLGYAIGSGLFCLGSVGRCLCGYLWRDLWRGQWWAGRAILGGSCAWNLGVMVLSGCHLLAGDTWVMQWLALLQAAAPDLALQDSLEIIGFSLSLPLIAAAIRWQIDNLGYHPAYGAVAAINQILAPWYEEPTTMLGQLARAVRQTPQAAPSGQQGGNPT